MIAKVLSGERPKRPKDPILTNKLWNLVQRCLEQNPERRPDIAGVVCDLQKALAVRQRDYAGVPGVTGTDDATLRWSRRQGLLSRRSSRTTASEVTPTELKGTPTLASNLLGRSNLDESLLDKARCIGSGDSMHDLHRTEPREFGTHEVVQYVSSRWCDLLRRTGSWLLNGRVPSTQDHRNRLDSSWEKRGMADAREVIS